MSNQKKKAVLVCTWDWYYYSHRRPIAKMFLDAGYEVVLVTRIYDLRDKIEADGVRVIDIPFSRPSLNPFRELAILRRLRSIYSQEQPDVVFHIAFKPVFLGSLAACWKKIPLRVNAIAGMGQLFLNRSFKVRTIRSLVMTVLARLFRHPGTRLIVQNRVDKDFLQRSLKLPDERVRLIRGVGVDLDEFRPTQPENPIPVITLVSRLIREKGIVELVEAASILKDQGLDFRVWLVGDPDFDSPEQITRAQLEAWQAEGLIEWKGFQEDVAGVYAKSDIAVLPSYSEGLPKSLLEAAACGLPIVTTDNGGCREVVEDGVNGLIVPPREANRLADALAKLIRDPDRRREMGEQSRHKAESEFGVEQITSQVASFCEVPTKSGVAND